MCVHVKGLSVKRQVVGLTVALGVAVASSWAATTQPTASITAKQASLKAWPMPSATRAEPAVTRLIVKLRNPSASELAQPMSASRMQALTATAGVGMKSVRAMSGGASLLALDAPVPLSEAKNIAARLALNPAVEYAEPDIMLKKLATPNEVRFMEWQWNLFAPTATYAGVAPGTVLHYADDDDRRRELAAGLGRDDRCQQCGGCDHRYRHTQSHRPERSAAGRIRTFRPVGSAGYDFISSSGRRWVTGQLRGERRRWSRCGSVRSGRLGDGRRRRRCIQRPATTDNRARKTAAGTVRMWPEWSLRRRTT